MRSMSPEEARQFASLWLPAWTGNDPLRVAEFYTDDVFYSDPTIPEGVSGKVAFIGYLTKLLGQNPDWVWTQESAIPMENGFLNKWKVDVPVGDRIVTCRGVCTVQFRGTLIYRNETYFDTLELITTIRNQNREKNKRPALKHK